MVKRIVIVGYAIQYGRIIMVIHFNKIGTLINKNWVVIFDKSDRYFYSNTANPVWYIIKEVI